MVPFIGSLASKLVVQEEPIIFKKRVHLVICARPCGFIPSQVSLVVAPVLECEFPLSVHKTVGEPTLKIRPIFEHDRS